MDGAFQAASTALPGVHLTVFAAPGGAVHDADGGWGETQDASDRSRNARSSARVVHDGPAGLLRRLSDARGVAALSLHHRRRTP